MVFGIIGCGRIEPETRGALLLEILFTLLLLVPILFQGFIALSQKAKKELGAVQESRVSYDGRHRWNTGSN
ncbi:hypothetical protein EBR03_05150 [bacterium]|nr:hypothetical protein [bacterium]NBX81717.1 hypothetical protein [bacterium]